MSTSFFSPFKKTFAWRSIRAPIRRHCGPHLHHRLPFISREIVFWHPGMPMIGPVIVFYQQPPKVPVLSSSNTARCQGFAQGLALFAWRPAYLRGTPGTRSLASCEAQGLLYRRDSGPAWWIETPARRSPRVRITALEDPIRPEPKLEEPTSSKELPPGDVFQVNQHPSMKAVRRHDLPDLLQCVIQSLLRRLV